jgi:hypothetical protein
LRNDKLLDTNNIIFYKVSNNFTLQTEVIFLYNNFFMQTEQQHWKIKTGWEAILDNNLGVSAQLVMVFGNRQLLENSQRFDEIRQMYPNANILIGSTAGEIIDVEVHDDTIVATAIYFEKTIIKVAKVEISASMNSEAAGSFLATELLAPNLKHVFVLSDGMVVNGSDLADGLQLVLPDSVSVTGGLAGDSANFQKTVVGLNEAPQSNKVVALGLYGDNINIGYASIGGWEAFGPERLVTRSEDNVLYELDDKPALELYKTYLGEKAAGLPATALLFPLSLENKDAANNMLVRTILTIDETKQSMTFAGDIPQGSKVRLMKANFEKLVDGAESASTMSQEILVADAELAILVSCVGRKLVMGQRIEDELEAVRAVVGGKTTLMGFYSYGELAPYTKFKPCLLHNQTMTVTLLAER